MFPSATNLQETKSDLPFSALLTSKKKMDQIYKKLCDIF